MSRCEKHGTEGGLCVQCVDERLAASGAREVAVDEAADIPQSVVDDLTATNKSTLEERALTEDEARAQVCRSTAAMLAASVNATQEELDKAKDLGQDGPAEETGRRIVKAAQELGMQLINQARKLDRPRILRPERSLRILRRH